MDCTFINLDRAGERRATLEANFGRYALPDWTLRRFAAIDAAHVAEARTPGRLTPGEKATFLSHRTVIGLQRGRPDPVMIFEDDARIGPRTCDGIATLVRQLRAPDWDIVFADLHIRSLSKMVELARYRNDLAAADEVALLDLRQFRFAGTSAYVLNPRSADKVHGLLSAEASIDVPIDITLDRLVQESRLAAFVIFPFLTTLSALSFSSQVRRIGADSWPYVWNLFTRMMWFDRDLDEVQRLRAAIDTSWMSEDERGRFGELMAAFDAGVVVAGPA